MERVEILKKQIEYYEKKYSYEERKDIVAELKRRLIRRMNKKRVKG